MGWGYSGKKDMNKITISPETNNCVGCCFNSTNKEFGTCKKDDCLQVIGGKRYDCRQKDIIYKREKDMNEMPELKAGMIIELGNKKRYLHINNNWGLSLEGYSYFTDVNPCEINCIYSTQSAGFNALNKTLTLIWSKKSDNDIKIEEIQNKMDDLKKELEALKSE